MGDVEYPRLVAIHEGMVDCQAFHQRGLQRTGITQARRVIVTLQQYGVHTGHISYVALVYAASATEREVSHDKCRNVAPDPVRFCRSRGGIDIAARGSD